MKNILYSSAIICIFSAVVFGWDSSGSGEFGYIPPRPQRTRQAAYSNQANNMSMVNTTALNQTTIANATTLNNGTNQAFFNRTCNETNPAFQSNFNRTQGWNGTNVSNQNQTLSRCNSTSITNGTNIAAFNRTRCNETNSNSTIPAANNATLTTNLNETRESCRTKNESSHPDWIELSDFLQTQLKDKPSANCSGNCTNGRICRSRYVGYRLECSK